MRVRKAELGTGHFRSIARGREGEKLIGQKIQKKGLGLIVAT